MLFRESDAGSKIDSIVREQAPGFYAQLAKGKIRVSLLEPAWRIHRSAIYQFRVSDEEGFSKDIVVKQRIYNSHYHSDIVSDTVKEFENLKLLEKKGEGQFRVVRALGMIEKKGLLFMERAHGQRFSELLRGFDWKKSSPQALEGIKTCFYSSGQWLRAFHECGFLGKKEKLPVDEEILETKKIIQGLGLAAKFTRAELVLDQMESLKKEAGSEEFPVVLTHGDFQLRNIILEKGEPTVADMGGCYSAIGLRDICDFLIGLFNFNMRNLFSCFTRQKQIDCATIFLDGYFLGQSKPHVAIKFYSMYCTMQQFKCIISRNRFSAPRLIRAMWYYRDLIIWLTNSDIK